MRAAVIAYSNAYLGGMGAEAFALVSQRCQLLIGEAVLSAQASAAKGIDGVLPIASLTVVSDDGSRAVVSYTYPVATLNQTNQPWLMEQGGWRYDAC